MSSRACLLVWTEGYVFYGKTIKQKQSRLGRKNVIQPHIKKQPLDGITTLTYRRGAAGGGGGLGGLVLPIMAYRESPLTPERGTGVFRLHVCEREGISLVQVYERVRKSVISVQIDCNT